jgi:hypothetical protein
MVSALTLLTLAVGSLATPIVRQLDLNATTPVNATFRPAGANASVTAMGVSSNGIDLFLGIPYAEPRTYASKRR